MEINTTDTKIKIEKDKIEIFSNITEQPCNCSCGWTGTVWDCKPDIDGDGNLGCPECDEIIEVYVE